MEHDALGAHARDELGITEELKARPVQAAAFSAVSFALGAALPLLIAVAFTGEWLIPTVAASSLICLTILGAVAARAGGAQMAVGAFRVLFWGAIAMAATALVGKLFGTAVS
jgi:VIT1/CCC1 family predicted Fe2+/Mn2+ transporter